MTVSDDTEDTTLTRKGRVSPLPRPRIWLIAFLCTLVLGPGAASAEQVSVALAHADRAYFEQAASDYAKAQAAGDGVAMARALLGSARHYKARGLWPQMEDAAERARMALPASGAPVEVRIDIDLAWAAAVQQQERTDEAFAPLTRALEQARALGDRAREARALVSLSSLSGRTGDLKRAQEQAQAAQAAAQQAGDYESQARALINLAHIARDLHDETRAAAAIDAALALPLDQDSSGVQEQLLVASASIARAAGDIKRALDLAQTAIRRANESGNVHLLGFALQIQGSSTCDQGDFAAAATAFTAAAAQYSEQTQPADAGRVQLAWSACQAKAGDYQGAYQRQKHGQELQECGMEQRRSETVDALNLAYQEQTREKQLAQARGESEALRAQLATQNLRLSGGGLVLLLLVSALLWLLMRARVLRSQTLAAQAAQSARSELLAVAGHEIRNPTQGLLAALTALRDAALTPAQRCALTTATHAADAIARLSKDAFELALSENRPMLARRRWVDINALLLDAAALIRPAAEAKGLALSLVDDSEGRRIQVDADRILQVLVNLLTNAVRYTESGAVHIRSQLVDSAPLRWICEISDSGPGIPPGELPHIFDAYFRGAQGLRSQGGGLGLAVVGRVIAAHQGRIEVCNLPGGGAAFRFELPLDSIERGDHVLAPPSPEGALRGLRMLLVDDDEDVRLGVAAMAEMAGAQVEWAIDTRGALALLQSFDPDIVLIDWHLGPERGDQVLLALKAAAPERARRWVLATGSMSMDIQNHGFDHILIKPFGPSELAASVRAA